MDTVAARVMGRAITLRPSGPADADFEFALFRSGHGPASLEATLGPEAASALIAMQFRARDATWSAHGAAVERSIICVGADDVGSLALAETAGELRLLDVVVSDGNRGGGVGSAVVKLLQERARSRCLPLRLHVLHSNAPARRFYVRAGFAETGRDATHAELEWRPT